MKTSRQLVELFEEGKNFNVRSTVINENIRVSTACIFYESSFFGDYYQKETFIFKKEGSSCMKIHHVGETEKCMEYLIRFHEKVVSLVRSKIK